MITVVRVGSLTWASVGTVAHGDLARVITVGGGRSTVIL
jgi:hypothetical protein